LVFSADRHNEFAELHEPMRCIHLSEMHPPPSEIDLSRSIWCTRWKRVASRPMTHAKDCSKSALVMFWSVWGEYSAVGRGNCRYHAVDIEGAGCRARPMNTGRRLWRHYLEWPFGLRTHRRVHQSALSWEDEVPAPIRVMLGEGRDIPTTDCREDYRLSVQEL
jgi:hypothetical protein